MGVTVEIDNGLRPDHHHSRSARRVCLWLWPAILEESCQTGGAVVEVRKHVANDPKCVELGWFCVPLADLMGIGVGSPRDIFQARAILLAASHTIQISKPTAAIFGCLNFNLTRAILMRSLRAL